MNLFQKAILRRNGDRPPVWFMRQAGRYHSHYQELKKQHSFMDLCKRPDLACETTLGPVRDFGFDAAILFSDLLFPLEVMGMGLEYSPGPKLGWHLKEPGDIARLTGGKEKARELSFQVEALRMIRQRLAADRGLLGFVGGPVTLYCYAVDGTHSGGLESSRAGFHDGRYDGFCDRLLELLAHNMAMQSNAGADCVAVLDTCAGEFDPETYRARIVPVLEELFRRFHGLCPGAPIAYYSKGTGPEHWKALESLPITYKGVDWHHPLDQVLRDWGERWAIQGNIDPHWLLELETAELEKRVRKVFESVLALPSRARRGWICGLGHGVLQHTPEAHVRKVLSLQKEMFE